MREKITTALELAGMASISTGAWFGWTPLARVLYVAGGCLVTVGFMQGAS